MTEQPFSDEVAFRIALAARALPDLTVADMIDALQSTLGDEITEEKLSQITVTKLKTAFGQTYDLDGEEDGEDANQGDINAFKAAVRILWGETEAIEPIHLDEYSEGDMSSSIRVAIASNSGELLNGHFGSCSRFLVYQVSADELRLIDIRSTAEAEDSDDRNAYRVSLIQDCHVLYIESIGGPAAAKVIKGGLYPMKIEAGGSAREILGQLQQAIATSPPPWLAKILGVADGERVKNYKVAEAVS
jgi:nitrogen fixation protein NifX